MEKGVVNEYAVSPKIAASTVSIVRLLDNFGVAHGRMISELPEAWLTKAREESDRQLFLNKKSNGSQDALQRDDFLNQMFKDRKMYFLESNRLVVGENWRQEVLASHKQKPFAGIFDYGAQNDDLFLDLEAARFTDPDNPAFQPIKITLKRNCEPQEFMDALGIIPDYGVEYKIIDRNFNPKVKKWYKNIEKLLERLQERSRTKTNEGGRIKVELVLADGKRFPKTGFEAYTPYQRDEFIEAIQENLSSVIGDLDFRVLFYPFDKMHARYILSERFGVWLDEGVDQDLNNERAQPVTRLDAETRDEQFEMFHEYDATHCHPFGKD
ncbi:hypothetical protein N9D99_08505 [Gammaproteobacteria bacterium]|nr:hypothetical protein [Gammaproteobacteria bacterium]